MTPIETSLNKLASELRSWLEKRLSGATFGPADWKLPAARVLVMEPKRSRKVLGWHSPQRWARGKASLDEIVVTPESVSHGVLATATILAHEFVHLANAAASRRDTSRQGRYHNDLFRESAVALGLRVKQDASGTNGWCVTELDADLKKFIQSLIRRKVVSAHPFSYQRKQSQSGDRSLVKMVVDCCDTFVYVTRARAETISICCGECGRSFRVADDGLTR